MKLAHLGAPLPYQQFRIGTLSGRRGIYIYVHPQQNSRAEFSMNLQHLVTSANFALMHFLIPYHCVVEYIQQYQNSKNNYKKKKKTHLFGSNKLRKVNT